MVTDTRCLANIALYGDQASLCNGTVEGHIGGLDSR